MPAEDVPDSKNPPRRTWLRILGILAACVLVAALLSAWWVKSNLYASPFDPTTLTDKEQQVLDATLDRLQRNMPSEPKASAARDAATKSEGRLAPQPYTEDAARRELRLTEKELNALVAKDEFAAQRVAIALSTDLISVKLVVPVDEEFPILGGKTLRLNCGVTLRYEAGKPVVALRGVSIGGVPIPNAWLGNIKDVDLVREFGGQDGFWDLFSKGVEDIRVLDGSLFVKLKE
ncbi:MAG: arginine N-succinyltransferase [candidate division NC10 bacterium]|nr:arginine N-succinyltransferase [candidate division NC10 bacterium]